MALTGRFTFRRTLWGKIVLQVEEEVRSLWKIWSRDARRRRWRDATLMDLAAVELRPLMDLRYRPPIDWGAYATIPRDTTAPPLRAANDADATIKAPKAADARMRPAAA